MKNIFRNIAIASVVATGLVATSCEDMMTVDTGDKTYVNAQDTLYSYLGIMRCMQNVAERQVILGEIRGDLVNSTDYTTDTLFAISNFDNPQDGTCSMLQVSDYYNVINNCNFYIYNCDTSAIKSNIKYMIPEYAQVKAIRAWAYLQLVKNYGSVPYITEPVSNISVITNFNYANNQVTKENLVDKVIEDGLLKFVDTNYPSYGNPANQWGSWNNGFTDISARLCYIPINVLLGDMYLLRGGSVSDYVKAAEYYKAFLNKEAAPMPLQYVNVRPLLGNQEYKAENINGWGTWGQVYNYTAASNEVITTIPGSANAGLGTMLTRVADIYGYTPSSSQSSSETLNEDGESTGEYDPSGAITVTRNYQRQYGPSEAFDDVCNDQTYVRWTGTTTNPIVSYIQNMDGRNAISVEKYEYEGEGYPLCAKAARGGSFYYAIPLYRKSLIWLRLAEAINRAGYPEFAFAILKDGLNQYSIPRVVDRYPERYDAEGRLVCYRPATDTYIYKDIETGIYWSYDENGELAEYTSSTSGYNVARDTIANDSIAYSSSNQMYYVADRDLINQFNNAFNFKDEIWNSTYGIHAKGTGVGSWTTSNTGEITTNISGTRDSVYYDYSKLLLAQGVNVATASRESLINAVENIIVDELALETAFEGNRFTDLVRIAEHKNASGFNGTDWLANKIANRGTKKATINSSAVNGYNASIFAKLQDQKNWYFSLPKWSTK